MRKIYLFSADGAPVGAWEGETVEEALEALALEARPPAPPRCPGEPPGAPAEPDDDLPW